MTPTVRAAIIEAAHDLIREGIETLTDLTGDLPDPREKIDEVIELRGLVTAIWPFASAPLFDGAPLGDGVVVPCPGGCNEHDPDTATAEEIATAPYAFAAYQTAAPFGVLIQVGMKDDRVPLRTLWFDGEALAKMLVEIGIAHLTGSDALQYIGPDGADPREAATVTIPDTVPDNLEGDVPS